MGQLTSSYLILFHVIQFQTALSSSCTPRYQTEPTFKYRQVANVMITCPETGHAAINCGTGWISTSALGTLASGSLLDWKFSEAKTRPHKLTFFVGHQNVQWFVKVESTARHLETFFGGERLNHKAKPPSSWEVSRFCTGTKNENNSPNFILRSCVILKQFSPMGRSWKSIPRKHGWCSSNILQRPKKQQKVIIFNSPRFRKGKYVFFYLKACSLAATS